MAQTEPEISKRLAKEIPEAISEYRLPDGTRVDILDVRAGIAWEVEWCDRSKVYEAVGQAVKYAAATDTEPGVWLLKRRGDVKSDEAYLSALVMIQYLKRYGVPMHLKVSEVDGG